MGLIELIMFESETPMGLRRLLTAQAQPWGSVEVLLACKMSCTRVCTDDDGYRAATRRDCADA